MADPRASADALLTEHFRYTPLSLIDEIINTVNAIVYRALNAVETGLLGTPSSALGFSSDEARRVEIEDGVHRLETLLEATIDRNFDKFEIYALRNILCVPDGLEKWMRLEHHKALSLPLHPNAPTPASIQALRAQLHESRALGLALESEAASGKAALDRLRALATSPQAPLSFLAPATSVSASTPAPSPLATTAQFASSQLPALRALLAVLRPHLGECEVGAMRARARAAAAKDPDSARERRKAYVDGEAERAVRGAVGVVERGDEGGGFGRGLGEEEVRALEEVVRAGKEGDDDEVKMEE